MFTRNRLMVVVMACLLLLGGLLAWQVPNLKVTSPKVTEPAPTRTAFPKGLPLPEPNAIPSSFRGRQVVASLPWTDTRPGGTTFTWTVDLSDDIELRVGCIVPHVEGPEAEGLPMLMVTLTIAGQVWLHQQCQTIRADLPELQDSMPAVATKELFASKGIVAGQQLELRVQIIREDQLTPIPDVGRYAAILAVYQ